MTSPVFFGRNPGEFIPQQEDVTPMLRDIIRPIGYALGGKKDASDIELYWHILATLSQKSPSIDFWKSIVSDGPNGTELDGMIETLPKPIQVVLLYGLKHIRSRHEQAKQSGKPDDWMQVEHRLGDIVHCISVNLDASNGSQQESPQEEASCRILNEAFEDIKTSCHVGGIRLLNTLGQIRSLFKKPPSLSDSLALIAIQMLQAGLKTMGISGIEENVHNVYYLLNRVAKETLLEDSYVAANQEEIDRNYATIFNKANELTYMLWDLSKIERPPSFKEIEPYIRPCGSPLTQEDRDAALI